MTQLPQDVKDRFEELEVNYGDPDSSSDDWVEPIHMDYEVKQVIFAFIAQELAAREKQVREKFIVRLGILRDRMKGCKEEPQDHDLSIFEIDSWIEEYKNLTPITNSSTNNAQKETL